MQLSGGDSMRHMWAMLWRRTLYDFVQTSYIIDWRVQLSASLKTKVGWEQAGPFDARQKSA